MRSRSKIILGWWVESVLRLRARLIGNFDVGDVTILFEKRVGIGSARMVRETVCESLLNGHYHHQYVKARSRVLGDW
jgi:hypothetical protein